MNGQLNIGPCKNACWRKKPEGKFNNKCPKTGVYYDDSGRHKIFCYQCKDAHYV